MPTGRRRRTAPSPKAAVDETVRDQRDLMRKRGLLPPSDGGALSAVDDTPWAEPRRRAKK